MACLIAAWSKIGTGLDAGLAAGHYIGQDVSAGSALQACYLRTYIGSVAASICQKPPCNGKKKTYIYIYLAHLFTLMMD